MKHCLIFMSFSFLCITHLFSQPLVDPFQVRYMYALRNNNSSATPFTHLWAGSDIPICLKIDTYLLLSPSYEQWNIDSSDVDEIYPTVHSIAFPVGLILPINKTKWSVTALAIPRLNGENLFEGNTFQFGGVALAAYSRLPHQVFKFGVYANAEFFGLFIVPLIGIDWRIDSKNNLFGILPGRLTFEHQWSNKFYGGATFRAPTNSFRLLNGQYMRIDDNQLSLYLDYYPADSICITLEPGVGIFRKLRTGIHGRDYIMDVKWGDGPFIKLSASYRIRL